MQICVVTNQLPFSTHFTNYDLDLVSWSAPQSISKGSESECDSAYLEIRIILEVWKIVYAILGVSKVLLQ